MKTKAAGRLRAASLFVGEMQLEARRNLVSAGVVRAGFEEQLISLAERIDGVLRSVERRHALSPELSRTVMVPHGFAQHPSDGDVSLTAEN